jgi:predicted RNA binding protein YcfA (HicA-like mRNA interferase family)
MRVPRDISGNELVKLLKRYGYHPTRQVGSHLRLTTTLRGEHHITIPMHNPIKIGTLNAVLKDIADHLGITRESLIQELFG